MGKLDSNVAIVTGSTSGIGAAAARRLAAEGARVVVTGRDEARGSRVTAEIRSSGGTALFVRADVSREEDCRRIVETTVRELGRLDILVNNAGTTSTVVLEEADEAEFDRILGVNLKSIFFACKYALPVMKRQRHGVIVTVASRGAIMPTHCSAIYAASKAAALQMTQAIGVNYGAYGIRANTILPSYIDTPMTDEFIQKSGQDYKAAIRALEEHTPVGRIGTSEDCANAILFLASEEASFITATPMLVDGGAVFGG
ncbi:MAG TPA: SDR family NAD(P)-dependent oxidoreductase [Spirochaetia bacterium]|nr:SDR family NAD(P)-dependent oxidoreductase [Spirochaetia bacterium]